MSWPLLIAHNMAVDCISYKFNVKQTMNCVDLTFAVKWCRGFRPFIQTKSSVFDGDLGLSIVSSSVGTTLSLARRCIFISDRRHVRTVIHPVILSFIRAPLQTRYSSVVLILPGYRFSPAVYWKTALVIIINNFSTLIHSSLNELG